MLVPIHLLDGVGKLLATDNNSYPKFLELSFSEIPDALLFEVDSFFLKLPEVPKKLSLL